MTVAPAAACRLTRAVVVLSSSTSALAFVGMNVNSSSSSRSSRRCLSLPFGRRRCQQSRLFMTTTTMSALTPVASLIGKEQELSPGFKVRRILPQAKQRTVGSFCFLDHFGPVSTNDHAMNVGPHPHIGLATLTYLYEGAVLHRDSTGAEQVILPGGVNYMSAGKGVTHSERGLPQDLKPHLPSTLPLPTTSHGLQLWLALPAEKEDTAPSFHHGQVVPINSECENANLVVGSFGKTNNNNTLQPSIPMEPEMGQVFYVDLWMKQPEEIFHECIGNSGPIEVGVYVVSGSIELQLHANKDHNDEQQQYSTGAFAVLKADEANATIRLQSKSSDTRVAILGGSPLPEKRFMFWNFVSTSQSKIEEASSAWTTDRVTNNNKNGEEEQFPPVVNESNSDSIPLPKPFRPRPK